MKRQLIAFAAVVLMGGQVAAEEKVNAAAKERGQVDSEGVVRSEGLAKSGLKRVTSLRYSILVRNPDGSESAVDEANHTFNRGDEFRLVVEADTELYLYVFHESVDGLRSFLVPDRHDPAGYVPRLERGKPLTIPQDGYFEVTPPVGIERLMVFASPVKRTELTSSEAFSEPEELSPQKRDELKRQQDRVFNTAMNVDPAKAKPQRKRASGPRIRLRGMSWRPKARQGETGKTIVVGSYDENDRPDLFLAIPLSSQN